MSSHLLDQQQTPKERAVFWVEYVMRHNGAAHLRSAARELNFFQYYCLDVVAILLGIAFIATLLTLFLAKRMMQRIAQFVGKISSGKKKLQ